MSLKTNIFLMFNDVWGCILWYCNHNYIIAIDRCPNVYGNQQHMNAIFLPNLCKGFQNDLSALTTLTISSGLNKLNYYIRDAFDLVCSTGTHHIPVLLVCDMKNTTSIMKWRLWCRKQVSSAGISNYIPHFTVRCRYLILPKIPVNFAVVE